MAIGQMSQRERIKWRVKRVLRWIDGKVPAMLSFGFGVLFGYAVWGR